MQFQKIALITAAALIATVSAEGYTPGEVWSTLSPSGTFAGAHTDYSATFGIAVQAVATASSVAKRDVAVSQINDGQIQATTKTVATTKVNEATTTAAVSQINDGQIQAATTSSVKPSSTNAVSQITDGQVQHTLASGAPTSSRTTLAPTTSTSSNATSATSTSADAGADIRAESCKADGTLELTLKDGILTDNKGRIGSIVANRQFQFDGPPPQAGAIYAAGWSITPEGNLAIGDNDVFYQCLSGNFYNLYDESIGAQCHPIHLEVVALVDC